MDDARQGQNTVAIGYVRVSTDDQGESGAGIDAQRQTIRDEAARRGWTLTQTIEDTASGKSLARPGISLCLDMLARKEANCLICSKLDRLSRSVKDFCGLVELATKQSWSLVVLDCNVDTSTPVGEMVANILATFAQFERRLIGMRTKEALAIKRLQGVVLGRPVEVNDDLLKLVAELHNRGDSLREIARVLSQRAILTPSGKKSWHPSSVRNVLLRASELGYAYKPD